MESILSASESHILEALDYRANKISPYAERRNEIQIHPSGGIFFSSSGVRTLTFNISGVGYADFSTLMLKFAVKMQLNTLILRSYMRRS